MTINAVIMTALIVGLPLQRRLESGGNAGEVTLTGILWGYSEDEGTKLHTNMLAPLVECMVAIFEHHFEDVTLVRYPPPFPGWAGRPAVIARKKRPVRA